MVYIPVMKALQAEQQALKNLSPRARSKIRPLLQYATGKRTENILSENRDIKFFLECPDLPFNKDLKDTCSKEEFFKRLKEEHSNFSPVVTVTGKDKPRDLVQHALKLLNEFGELLVKVKITDSSQELNDSQLMKLVALYSCLPLENTLFMMDFEKVQNSDVISKKIFPLILNYMSEDARIGFTATIWPPSQSNFPKNELVVLENWPFLAFLELKEKVAFYSDYLTEHPESVTGEVDFPLTIIPYFKWLSLDGERQAIMRAEEFRSSPKELAAEFVESIGEGFLHDANCKGCEELRSIADLTDLEKNKSNPMTRKRAGFIHYIEAIAALI